MSAADQRNIDGVQFEKVTRYHYQCVNDEGGIAMSYSTADRTRDVAREDALAWCEATGRGRYHVEELEQSYWISDAEWKWIRRVEPEPTP
jgi:hypothetical protein